MFREAMAWTQLLNHLEIVRRGDAVLISNATVEEMSRSASLINDPARAGLARLWDWPGQGLAFAEFWEECPEVAWSGHRGLYFGAGRTDLFVQTTDAILHVAVDRAEQRVIETSFAGADIDAFADIYRVFLGHILLSTKSADIAAALRAFSPRLTQRDAANGMVNYWWGIAEALAYEELSLGKDFLYYRDRAAGQNTV